MSVADDLQGIANDLTALQAGVAQAVTDLNSETSTTESAGDQVLAAIIPVLTSAGYTVTPPAELPEGSTDGTVADNTPSAS
jgi:hypothetical protein